MSVVLTRNINNTKLPITYIAGVDYPTGSPTLENKELFKNSPQGLDMASTAHSFLEQMPKHPVIGISGNIPEHILEDIPKTGRTMWVFFNRVMPHSFFSSIENKPDVLKVLKTQKTRNNDYLKKKLVNSEAFKYGLFWVEGGIKILKPYEDWNKEIKPEQHADSNMRPWWYGWTKQLSDYTVGAKIVYFPPRLVYKLYEDYHYQGDKKKIRLQHMDRFIKSLNPIMGESKVINRSRMPKLEMFCLFEKKSSYGTKHNPALKCDKPIAEYKYNSTSNRFIYIGDDPKKKLEVLNL